MSLVDGDHVIPAKARHGAHYFGKARHDGAIVPAMKMYQTEYQKRRCPDCQKMNYDFLECVYCGGDLREIEPIKVQAHK